MTAIVIGLTGNIATGKSAVMRMATDRGALTIDADAVVRDLLRENVTVQDAVEAHFGRSVRRVDKSIDRAALGAIVFQNPDELRSLERIVHPHVTPRILSLMRGSDAAVVMIEAIKLLEGDLWRICSEIWVTDCSYDCQLQRLQVCRGLEESAAAARIRAQPSAEEKIARADVVIDTNGLMWETEQQFDRAWAKLVERQAGHRD